DRRDLGGRFPLCLEGPRPVRGGMVLELAMADGGHIADPVVIGRARLEMAAAGAALGWFHHLPAGLPELCGLSSPRLGHSRPSGGVFAGYVPAATRRPGLGRCGP